MAIGNRVGADVIRETASVVGPLCTPLDLLPDRMGPAAAEIGELVVVFQSGAWRKRKSTVLLGHPGCVEVLV